jgi:hypothetical protein
MNFSMKSIKSHRVQLFAEASRLNKVSTAFRRPVVTAAAGFNLNKALDKAHELKSLKEVVDLPVSALQGVAEHSDETLAALNIRSVKDLGAWKYYKAAKAIAALASVEVRKEMHLFFEK